MDGDIIQIVKRTGRHSGQPFNQDVLFNQTVLFGCTFIILFLFPDEQRYFSQRHRTQKYSSELVVNGTSHLAVLVLETSTFQVTAVSMAAVRLTNALDRGHCNQEIEKSSSQHYSLLF